MLPSLVFIAGCVLTGWPFRLDEGRFEERLRLSKVLMNRGDYEQALAIIVDDLKLHPDHPALLYETACYEALLGRRDDSIAHLRESVER